MRPVRTWNRHRRRPSCRGIFPPPREAVEHGNGRLPHVHRDHDHPACRGPPLTPISKPGDLRRITRIRGAIASTLPARSLQPQKVRHRLGIVCPIHDADFASKVLLQPATPACVRTTPVPGERVVPLPIAGDHAAHPGLLGECRHFSGLSLPTERLDDRSILDDARPAREFQVVRLALHRAQAGRGAHRQLHRHRPDRPKAWTRGKSLSDPLASSWSAAGAFSGARHPQRGGRHESRVPPEQ